MTHLKLDAHTAFDCGENRHPEQVMRALGITYQLATPQSMADQWWFWNCENVPTPLPKYLKVLDMDPVDAIGFGLSQEDVERLTGAKPV